jgi:ribosomal protein L7/L12
MTLQFDEFLDSLDIQTLADLAKNATSRLAERAVNFEAISRGPTAGGILMVNENEKNLIRTGHFIDAIKAVRTRTSATLRDAKEACDEFRASF